MDVIARFDRGPREEIRVSLVNREGQIYLDLRVFRKSATSTREPLPSTEGISVPLALFGKLCRAIQAVDEAVRRRKLLPREALGAAPVLGGEPAGAPGSRAAAAAAARAEARHLGRTDLRLRLECPVEYVVRGRSREPHEPERRLGRTKDISRTGAHAMLPERIPEGTVLDVTLDLPAGSLSLACEVVWAQHSTIMEIAREGCRHGLRFSGVGQEEGRLLDRLLSEGARQPSAPPA